MPDKHKKDISIEVLVGLFMFIILIALGVFTIVLSRQNFLEKKYPIEVKFENIGGLREGDHILLRGTQVGVVKSTHLKNNYVIVRSDLEVPILFREGYKVEIVASSMLGGKVMKIYAGPSLAMAIPLGQDIRGELPIDILDELGIAVAEIQEMTENVAAGEGTLGKLLSKDDALYEDIHASAANIRSITEKINEGNGTFGKLVEDDQLYLEAQKLLEELRAAIDDMRETSPVTTFGSVVFGAF